MHRRNFLNGIGLSLSSLLTASGKVASDTLENAQNKAENEESVVLNTEEMGFQWPTLDPFLFCVHHEDQFPKGNAKLEVDASYLKGRHIGDDFIIKDGFRMYHGDKVPGFPGHPHRGFETVTVVRTGLVDHADSMGASGRYGNGDVQWMTAGKGVQHSEMFPLFHSDKENPLELFQIWLNLPKTNKMVEPHFKMLWKESIPKIETNDKNGKKVLVEVIAGKIDSYVAPTPPPNSWAANASNEVSIWNIKMEKGTQYTLPPATVGTGRMLYLYEGSLLKINNSVLKGYHAAQLKPDKITTIFAENNDVSILILQGKPIGEPVIQYGPFVMNTKAEINKAFEDYHNTQFGGWPWPQYDQVHAANLGRFAKHADGTIETKEG
ncbi:MAG: pirin family protein [Cytophagales bacterium]